MIRRPDNDNIGAGWIFLAVVVALGIVILLLAGFWKLAGLTYGQFKQLFA